MTVKNRSFPYRTSFSGGVYGEGSVTPEGSDCHKIITCPQDETFAAVPRMLLPLSALSSSQRHHLIHRLRQELLQLRSFQKAVQLPKSSVHVTSTPPATNLKTSPCSTKPAPVSTATMLLMKQCETLLKRLMSHPYGHLFNTPVDVLKMNIPDYFTIIKHPMDLGTVKHKFHSGSYSTPSDFSADVRLTFSNAMTYNPPGNPVYMMADTLCKFFEVRWKTIEKKSSTSQPCNPAHNETAMPEPLFKKRKMDPVNHDHFVEPAKQVMADEDRVKLGRDLGFLTQFPVSIINFLRDHCSNEGGSGDDELEIDINDLSNGALFQLRNLLDEFLLENHKNGSNCEPCELELLPGSGSGPGSSLIQHYDGSGIKDEDIDIAYYEHPKSRISPVRTEKAKAVGNSSRVKSVPDYPDTTRILSSSKLIQEPESVELESSLHGATSNSPRRKQAPVSGLDQLEDASNEKQTCVEGEDCRRDGNSAQNEKQLPQEKLHRAALLKNQYADLILKARGRAFNQNEKRDPEKMRREKEELELQKKKEKARLQAEAKEAEEARRKAEAAAAAQAGSEAKRKLELEREAARKALLEMEKSVEINENSGFLKDLELLKTTTRREQLTKTREEEEEYGLGVLGFGGSNPLEQLGLFMKHEDEDEEETDPLVALPGPLRISEEVEEGEID